ncbi:efflux RND transporter permease subunit [Marinagarivorans algicola]|uniref:efflux RND transporter permease subunit n=1 Tax=Marinagarivorans algicola TaxID=1513270 RepID=UPI0006B5313D|nr:MMPL family transporter [Marinagarivorans algicola]
MIDQAAAKWLNFVVKYPKAILLLIVLALAVAVAGLPKLRLDASSDSLTLERDADLDYFREVSKQYDSGDFLVVTYSPNTPLFEDAALNTLNELHKELANIEGVTGINSILNVPLLYSPKLSLRDMAKEPRNLLDPGVDRALAKAEFLESPIYRKLILSPDGNTTALQLNLAVDLEYIRLVSARDDLRLKQKKQGLNAQEAAALKAVSAEFAVHKTKAEAAARARVQAVREVVGQYKSDAQIYVGGITMITADMITFIRKDLVVFGSAALLFMVFILAFIFRSIKFVVIPLVTCVSAVTMTLGIISWADWHLTVISSNFVALLLIIALAIIIHLVVRYREYAEEQPNWTQQQLVLATCQYMIKPCLYTALTTIVAFVSLVVSDIRPVMDFGWMMTIGLILAVVLAFVLLPAALVLLPRETVKPTSPAQQGKPFTAYCAVAVERLGRGILVISIVVLAVSIWGISRLQVENRFVDYFHDETEIHKGLSLIDQKLGGTTSFDIILAPEAATALLMASAASDEGSAAMNADGDDIDEFGGVDPFAQPAATEEDPFGDADPFNEQTPQQASIWMTVAGLQLIEQITDYLDALPEVGKVQSLATLYKVGKDINGSLNNFELALMEQALTDDVSQVLVAPYLDANNDQARITMRIIDTYPGLQRAKLVERIRSDLAAMDGVDIDHVRFSGLLILYNNMLQSLFSSQIVTMGAVFLGIGFMFLLLFRSLTIALVALVPNILAASAILGGMGLVGIPLDMMTITIAAITVGIGVDDTIHYIHRFKTELAIDGDYMQAMHRAHSSIGRAMYYTSVIIIFGFSIMVLSQFIPTIYFGLLTGLAMLAALSGALFLLPQLILLAKPFKVNAQ